MVDIMRQNDWMVPKGWFLRDTGCKGRLYFLEIWMTGESVPVPSSTIWTEITVHSVHKTAEASSGYIEKSRNEVCDLSQWYDLPTSGTFQATNTTPNCSRPAPETSHSHKLGEISSSHSISFKQKKAMGFAEQVIITAEHQTGHMNQQVNQQSRKYKCCVFLIQCSFQLMSCRYLKNPENTTLLTLNSTNT